MGAATGVLTENAIRAGLAEKIGWVGWMLDFLRLFVHVLAAPFRTQAQLEAEITMLAVLRRQAPSKPRLTTAERLLFVWLCRLFLSPRTAITIVQPDMVLRWHRAGFRLYWRWKSRSRGGRPKIPVEVRSLIRRMSEENRLVCGF